MSGPVGTTSKRSTKRGSEFSDRQIAHAVRDRKMVKAILPNGEDVSGFVYGSDDYHWGIVTLDDRTLLVHKSATCVEILPWGVDDRPESSFIREVTEPFRDYVMQKFFGKTQTQSPPSSL